MTISKKQLEEAKDEQFDSGLYQGRLLGRQEAFSEFNNSKAAAQRNIMNAAAELAQANAKLTYAMSRMIAEKGW